MTPFMSEVEAVLEGRNGHDVLTVPSLAKHLGNGMHEHVELRALAEQLVSEANIVLSGVNRSITLVDHPGEEGLVFHLACGRVDAQISARVSGRQAWNQLIIDGQVGEPRELTGCEALPGLLLSLIAEAVRYPVKA